MFYIIITIVTIFTIWIGWELYRAPNMEDENTTFIDDPTTTCWHDDDENKNHTEGDF
jgi:hypothetical protein